jgi:hypothetical protein
MKLIRQNASNKRWIFLSLTSVLLIAVVGFTVILWSDPKGDYHLKRIVQFRFTLQNTSNRVKWDSDFLVYAPVAETSVHRTLDFEANSPFTLSTDNFGNQVLRFNFSRLAPFETRTIQVRVFLAVARTPQPIAAEIQSFLQAEPYIETDNPELIELAGKLTAENRVATARRAFKWILDNINYVGYARNAHGAVYALRNRRGDCTELMYLFTALARLNDLPTRTAGGYLYQEGSSLRSSDFHNWAEVYIDGKWRVVDPKRRGFMENEMNYLTMSLPKNQTDQDMPNNTHRFTVSDEDIRVQMY